MRTTQALTITLPHDMLGMIKAKVARDAVIEIWLREEVGKSFDECAADASLGVPASEVMQRVRDQYRQRTSAQ